MLGEHGAGGSFTLGASHWGNFALESFALEVFNGSRCLGTPCSSSSNLYVSQCDPGQDMEGNLRHRAFIDR